MADDMITDAEIAEVMREAGERLTAAQHRADQAEALNAELAAALRHMHTRGLHLAARLVRVVGPDNLPAKYGELIDREPVVECALELRREADAAVKIANRTAAAAAERVALLEDLFRQVKKRDEAVASRARGDVDVMDLAIMQTLARLDAAVGDGDG